MKNTRFKAFVIPVANFLLFASWKASFQNSQDQFMKIRPVATFIVFWKENIWLIKKKIYATRHTFETCFSFNRLLTLPVPISDEEKKLSQIFVFILLCGALIFISIQLSKMHGTGWVNLCWYRNESKQTSEVSQLKSQDNNILSLWQCVSKVLPE